MIFWTSDNGETQITLYQGHVLDVLRQLPSESVHCVVTSPPYWGLRDYGLPPVVWGGDPECKHEWGPAEVYHGHRGSRGQEPQTKWPSNTTYPQHTGAAQSFCARCGAWRGQLGLEPSPDLYVQHIVEIFREVRRVLRPEGTLWLNMGDTYLAQQGAGFNGQRRFDEANRNIRLPRPTGVKPKDLLGIPWAVAFALRADGWYLRSDIIIAKANPMPESVKDRPTRAHEYVFLLTKRPRYFYDADAIREPHTKQGTPGHLRAGAGHRHPNHQRLAGRLSAPPRVKTAETPHLGGRRQAPEPGEGGAFHPLGRNKRSVWTIATEPFPDAHFAVMPSVVAELCILAGTPAKVCPSCGAPWRRGRPTDEGAPADWRPDCACPGNDGSGRAVVLDPFVGAGTVALVAQRLGRSAIGIDLNPDYLAMARRRIEAEHVQRRLPVGF